MPPSIDKISKGISIVAHKYQTLRMEDVYETVTADFPALYQELQVMILES